MSKIEVLEEPLQMGQVKMIYSNGYQNTDLVELLFSPSIKATFCKKDNKLSFTLYDTQFKIPDLSCLMDKQTVEILIRGLKEIYNQLEKESECSL